MPKCENIFYSFVHPCIHYNHLMLQTVKQLLRRILLSNRRCFLFAPYLIQNTDVFRSSQQYNENHHYLYWPFGLWQEITVVLYWGLTSLQRYFSHIVSWKQEITNLWKFKWRGRESNPGPLAPQDKLTTRPPRNNGLESRCFNIICSCSGIINKEKRMWYTVVKTIFLR